MDDPLGTANFAPRADTPSDGMIKGMLSMVFQGIVRDRHEQHRPFLDTLADSDVLNALDEGKPRTIQLEIRVPTKNEMYRALAPMCDKFDSVPPQLLDDVIKQVVDDYFEDRGKPQHTTIKHGNVTVVAKEVTREGEVEDSFFTQLYLKARLSDNPIAVNVMSINGCPLVYDQSATPLNSDRFADSVCLADAFNAMKSRPETAMIAPYMHLSGVKDHSPGIAPDNTIWITQDYYTYPLPEGTTSKDKAETIIGHEAWHCLNGDTNKKTTTNIVKDTLTGYFNPKEGDIGAVPTLQVFMDATLPHMRAEALLQRASGPLVMQQLMTIHEAANQVIAAAQQMEPYKMVHAGEQIPFASLNAAHVALDREIAQHTEVTPNFVAHAQAISPAPDGAPILGATTFLMCAPMMPPTINTPPNFYDVIGVQCALSTLMLQRDAVHNAANTLANAASLLAESGEVSSDLGGVSFATNPEAAAKILGAIKDLHTEPDNKDGKPTSAQDKIIKDIQEKIAKVSSHQSQENREADGEVFAAATQRARPATPRELAIENNRGDFAASGEGHLVSAPTAAGLAKTPQRGNKL